MATIVAFHAHPDDEVLLTGGTIARLAADGHRVIIVMACDGDMWDGPDRGRRLDELRASAAILGADQAVHLGYDRHRDHVRVHEVGARAAELAGVRVAEVTVPRELFVRLARPLLLLRLLTGYRAGDMRGYGLPRSAITHRVDVRRQVAQKRAALAAHWGQASGWGRGARLMRILLRSPWPAFRVALGTEWFAEPGGRTGDLVTPDQAAGPGRS